MRLVAPTVDSSSMISRPRAPVVARKPARARPRIVVADDNADVRRFLAAALRCDGYEVTEVLDGGRLLVEIAGAYGAAHSMGQCDLFVSDIRMPICGGIEILEAARRANWRTPWILMTAFANGATRDHVERLGAILFEKPFDIEELRMAVARLLASPHSAPATAGGRSFERS